MYVSQQFATQPRYDPSCYRDYYIIAVARGGGGGVQFFTTNVPTYKNVYFFLVCSMNDNLFKLL